MPCLVFFWYVALSHLSREVSTLVYRLLLLVRSEPPSHMRPMTIVGYRLVFDSPLPSPIFRSAQLEASSVDVVLRVWAVVWLAYFSINKSVWLKVPSELHITVRRLVICHCPAAHCPSVISRTSLRAFCPKQSKSDFVRTSPVKNSDSAYIFVS